MPKMLWREQNPVGAFREESQTTEERQCEMTKLYLCFCMGIQRKPSNAKLHKEVLKYDEIEVKTRSYK